MLHRPTKPLSAACLVVSGACLVVSGVPGQNKKISHVYIADKTLKKNDSKLNKKQVHSLPHIKGSDFRQCFNQPNQSGAPPGGG